MHFRKIVGTEVMWLLTGIDKWKTCREGEVEVCKLRNTSRILQLTLFLVLMVHPVTMFQNVPMLWKYGRQ